MRPNGSDPAVAPPSALTRAPGWRDRLRARRARRHGVVAEGPVAIGRGVRFDVTEGGRVVLGAGCALGDGCRLHVHGGEVRIGAGTILGERCALTAHAAITIGERCLLADEAVLIDLAPRTGDPERPVREQGVRPLPIAVGDGARLGPGAVVEAGAEIPEGAIVGAHAVSPPAPPAARPSRGGRAPR